MPNKGHLAVGADADVSVIDFERKKAYATVVNGQIIMKDGQLLGCGTGIICDERGKATLEKRGIRAIVKGVLDPEAIKDRFIP